MYVCAWQLYFIFLNFVQGPLVVGVLLCCLFVSICWPGPNGKWREEGSGDLG